MDPEKKDPCRVDPFPQNFSAVLKFHVVSCASAEEGILGRLSFGPKQPGSGLGQESHEQRRIDRPESMNRGPLRAVKPEGRVIHLVSNNS